MEWSLSQIYRQHLKPNKTSQRTGKEFDKQLFFHPNLIIEAHFLEIMPHQKIVSGKDADH